MSALAFEAFLVACVVMPGQLIPGNHRKSWLTASAIMLGAILPSSIGTHRTMPWLAKPAVRTP